MEDLFIRLQLEPEMMDFKNKENHQVAGNQRVRLSRESKIREDLSWKKEMPFLDKLKLNLLFGWLNLFYKLKGRKYDKEYF